MSDLIDFDVNIFQRYGTLAGLDEAGRGALAGPVFVGCASVDVDEVDLVGDADLGEINDSKQLTENIREKLFNYLVKHVNVHVGIGQASSEEIDRVGINPAVSRAAGRALASLGVEVDRLLLDRGINYEGTLPSVEYKKGDEKSLHVASASVLAKVGRDRYMRKQSDRYPGYGWRKNVGYGTAEHRDGIRRFGPTPLHRKSYKLT